VGGAHDDVSNSLYHPDDFPVGS
jgi:hypothetical protein